MVNVEDIIEMIEEILDDSTLPKNIKSKLDEISKILKNSKEEEMKLTVDKCIHELDDVTSDINIQPFVRTQIWSVVSMLESLEE